MDHQTISMLRNGIDRILAKNLLRDLSVSSYPNMKDSDRRKFHRKMHKEAYPESFEEKTIKTTDLELI